jgi:FixJ family two-component response regulator
MSSTPASIVKTSAIVISVALDADVNGLAAGIAESAGLRFRQYSSMERLADAAIQRHAGCIVAQCLSDQSQATDLLDRLTSSFLQMPIILVTESCRTAVAVELMRSGAFSVVEYPVDRDALQEIIQEACRLSAEIQSACEESNNARLRMQEATDKELEVLDLVLAGHRNKDIADQLGITIRAVEDRRIRLMKKLRVQSFAELVELAVIFRRAKRDERLSARLIRRGARPRRFVRGVEVWEPNSDCSRLHLTQSSYRDADAMEHISRDLSFSINEGLPGEVWTGKMPVFYRELTTGPFVRSDAAAAAGLTTGVGIPVFRDGRLQSVILLLLDGGESLKTVIEHWRMNDVTDRYELYGGFYANCERLRRLSEFVSCPAGEGLPGIIAQRQMPYLGTRFADDSNEVRGVVIDAERLHSGIGLPLTDSGRRHEDVLLLLNSDSTPLFRMMQIWKPASSGASATMVSEVFDGERSLQSRCGRSVPSAIQSLLADLIHAHQPRIVTHGETLSGLAAEQRTFTPSLGIAIPTFHRGQLAALSILVD